MLNSTRILLPLTTAQRGIWMAGHLAPAGASFNIAEAIEISGPVDTDLFIEALNQLCREVETTRVRIVETPDGPAQEVLPLPRMRFPAIDLSGDPDPWAAAQAWMQARVAAPVDVTRDPLWQAAILKLSADRSIWFHCCHHVALDGYSGGLIAARVAEVYTALVEGRAPAPHGFEPLSTLVEQERAYAASERRETDRAYWAEKLHALPDAVSLETGRAPRICEGHPGFIRRSWHIPPATTARLTALGREHDATLPQVLTAIVAAYVFRMTGQADLVLGMPVSARANRIVRRVPGMAANAAALRFAVPPDETFPALLRQARRAMRGALRHQQFRYEDLRRALGFHDIDRHVARIAVNIEPFDYDLRFAGHASRNHNLSNGAMEGLTVFVFDRQDGHGLVMNFDANPTLYTTAELDDHLRRVERLAGQIIDAPDAAISAHALLSAAERTHLTTVLNAREQAWPDGDIVRLIRERAAENAGRTAIADANGTLTYGALLAETQALSRRLRDLGVGPGDLVGVMLPRDRRMVAGLLAIAAAEAAWLPLDAGGPVQRTRQIMEDARPALLVTADDAVDDALALASCPILILGRHESRLARPTLLRTPPKTPMDVAGEYIPLSRPPVVPPGTAYVTYTSGTTGVPKGVIVPHTALKNVLLSMQDLLDVKSSDRLLAVTSLTFDIAILELFLPLLAGAEVVLATRDQARDPWCLAGLIEAHAITAMQATPSQWQSILAAGRQESLRGLLLLSGGEALPGHLAAQLCALGSAAFNLYGPTETTIWSALHRLRSGDDLASPPVGRPIANTRIYILDAAGEPLPRGAVGELAIGGDGVATGYLNRPDLTQARFQPDPLSGVPGARRYHTGDRAMLDADGLIWFLGRADDQIKVKGVRIEPGEIESALLALPQIGQAAAILYRDPQGAAAPVLTAYIVAADGAMPAGDATLRRHLATLLPQQAIPECFVTLESLPLTATGKLDRRALPKPMAAGETGRDIALPRTQLELQLATILCEVLGLERIGIHDNFFELGGDSLAAVKLVTALSEQGLELPLGRLFATPTIANLAPLFGGAAPQAGCDSLVHDLLGPDLLGTLFPIRVDGAGPPIFCIHPALGVAWGFTALAPHLPAEYRVYGLQNAGLLMSDTPPRSVEEIVETYLALILGLQPEGPYHLIGWSMGGLLAHGISSRLEGKGETVRLLAMLDSYPFLSTAAGGAMHETMRARAALDFLGLQHNAGDSLPTLEDLGDLVAREADVGAIALPDELGTVDEFGETLRRVVLHNLDLVSRYRPGHVDTGALFLRAALRGGDGASALIEDNPEAWLDHLGGGLEQYDLSCRHQDMLKPVHAAEAGRLISQRLLRRDAAVPVPRASRETAAIGAR